MDAGDLIFLDAIIHDGSITGAARQLGQPKATVSRRLRRLEAAVGAPLFDRTSRRLRLTRLGESLAEPAAAVRVALAGAQSLVQSGRRGEKARLRIAAPFLFGRLVLSPLIGQFLADHPDSRATLKFANETVDPLRDDYDIAIQVSEPKQPYLVQVKLASADLKLYAAPRIADQISRASDLADHLTISTSNIDRPSIVLHLNDGNRAVEATMDVLCTVNDPDAACSIAAAGSGVAALPVFLARRLVEERALKPVLPRFRVGSVGIYATLPPGRLAIPVVRKFLAALKRELARRRFGA